MNTAPFQGHYTLLEETPGCMLFTRTLQQRCRSGLAVGAVAVGLFMVACYSLLRPQQDWPGFIFFLVSASACAGVAVYTRFSWTEIEICRPQHCILKRRYVWNRMRKPGTLSFDQLAGVTIKKTLAEFSDSFHLQLFLRSGQVWATLPGYQVENQAQEIRKKILAGMQD
jgi:hypothetical protein